MLRLGFRTLAGISVVLLVACGGDPPAASDGGGVDAPAVDALAAHGDGALDGVLEATSTDAFGADHRVTPDVGAQAALIIEQIAVDGLMGESALIVGPDGTSTLIDVGGPSHTAAVLEAVDRRLGRRVVDWIVITHYHFDHVGGFAKLVRSGAVNGNRPLKVRRGVISRGLVDLGDVARTTSTFQDYCRETRQSAWNGKRFDVCSGPKPAPCDGKGPGDPWPASSCSGLFLGDLLDKTDDGRGRPSSVSLGGGARLTLFFANGRVATSTGVRSAQASGVTIGHGGTDPENNRSLGGVIGWGSFRYLFGGDLSRKAEDVIVKYAATILAGKGGPPLIPRGGLDVLHLGHHGLGSSTGQPWVDWLLPADSRDRNAIVGANGMYIIAPAGPVLDRVGARINQGLIWQTFGALLGGKHKRQRIVGGALVTRVKRGGASYEIFGWVKGKATPKATFVSTP